MSIASGIANKILNTKMMTCLTRPNAPSAAATIANISCITKDAVNCYYYVTQSLNNDKIPEEKRKFVAGLDLSNGILNVITQYITGQLVIKNQNSIFKKCCGSFFEPENIKKLYENNKNIVNMPIEAFTENCKRLEGMAKTGLGVFATLFVTQIIAKRIIVPLIATPMASFFKKQFEGGKTNKTTNTNNNVKLSENKETMSNPQKKDLILRKIELPDFYKNMMR